MDAIQRAPTAALHILNGITQGQMHGLLGGLCYLLGSWNYGMGLWDYSHVHVMLLRTSDACRSMQHTQ